MLVRDGQVDGFSVAELEHQELLKWFEWVYDRGTSICCLMVTISWAFYIKIKTLEDFMLKIFKLGDFILKII